MDDFPRRASRGSHAHTIHNTFSGLSHELGGHKAVAMAARLLCLDPNARPAAKDALDHAYFTDDPQPELRPVTAADS